MSVHSFVGSNNHFKGSTVFGNCYVSGSSSVLNTKGIQIKGDGTYIIDGKEYKSDEVTVRTEYKIKSTGESVYTEPDHFSLKLQGDNMSVTVSTESGNLEIDCENKCTFRKVNTISGNIIVRGDVNTIQTVSGDVSVDGSVSGPVTTVSGNIRSRNK